MLLSLLFNSLKVKKKNQKIFSKSETSNIKIIDNNFLNLEKKCLDNYVFLITLNLKINSGIFKRIYEISNFVIAADGGADRFYNYFLEDKSEYNK